MGDETAWRVSTVRLSQGAPVELVQPSLEQVLGLFGRLTGEGGDLFIHGTPGERILMVAGGPTRFVVSCIGTDYGAYNLLDEAVAGADDWITLTAGGVPTPVEVSATVSAALVEQAIRYFYARGAIDPQLCWE